MKKLLLSILGILVLCVSTDTAYSAAGLSITEKLRIMQTHEPVKFENLRRLLSDPNLEFDDDTIEYLLTNGLIKKEGTNLDLVITREELITFINNQYRERKK